MPQLEVFLAYRADGLDGANALPLGRTCEAGAVRAVRDVLVQQARAEAQRWQGVDEGVFAVKAAEFERLCKVLAFLAPENAARPELRIVKRERQPATRATPPRGSSSP